MVEGTNFAGRHPPRGVLTVLGKEVVRKPPLLWHRTEWPSTGSRGWWAKRPSVELRRRGVTAHGGGDELRGAASVTRCADGATLGKARGLGPLPSLRREASPRVAPSIHGGGAVRMQADVWPDSLLRSMATGVARAATNTKNSAAGSGVDSPRLGGTSPAVKQTALPASAVADACRSPRGSTKDMAIPRAVNGAAPMKEAREAVADVLNHWAYCWVVGPGTGPPSLARGTTEGRRAPRDREGHRLEVQPAQELGVDGDDDGAQRHEQGSHRR